MKHIRRTEKAIQKKSDMQAIIEQAKYVTIAMSDDNEPYLVTLSHGYDRKRNVIYFHCAQEGKKIEILSNNNIVWGQALVDHGYVQGKCDHLYSTVHFRGTAVFLSDLDEKREALHIMIHQLEDNPDNVINEQITEASLIRVKIGRIDIDYMSGKKSKEVVISQ